MPALLVLLALAAAPPSPLSGQTQADFDRFTLFTECRPPYSSVYVRGDEAAEMHLALDRMLADRMEAAGLGRRDEYDLTEVLEVDARTQDDGPAFMIRATLMKEVHDHSSGTVFLASTWESLRVGTHDGSADPVMQALSGVLDEFIAEYLRVNDCPP